MSDFSGCSAGGIAGVDSLVHRHAVLQQLERFRQFAKPCVPPCEEVKRRSTIGDAWQQLFDGSDFGTQVQLIH
jgi:hypothetical protein